MEQRTPLIENDLLNGTGRDVYIYNFSHDICAENAKRMTQDYLAAIAELDEKSELTVDEVTLLHNSHIKWEQTLRRNWHER